MNKIELKPGLYLEGDYAYISNPRIASYFLWKFAGNINNAHKYNVVKFDDDGFWLYDDQEEDYYDYPLKIHKSIFKSEVDPVKGEDAIHMNNLHGIRILYDYSIQKSLGGYRGNYDIIIKASEITLNLNIEKLNQLWEWLYGEWK